MDELNALAELRQARFFVVHRSKPVISRSSWLPEHAAHVSDVEALRLIAPDVESAMTCSCGNPGWVAAVELAAPMPARVCRPSRSTSDTSPTDRLARRDTGAGRRSVRRIVIVMLSTITVVVLLFSYHTSTNNSTNAGSTPPPPAGF